MEDKIKTQLAELEERYKQLTTASQAIARELPEIKGRILALRELIAPAPPEAVED